jgi:hypothetical protein
MPKGKDEGETQKYAGSYNNTATRWGQFATGDHIASTQDNMLGIDGNRDILVMKDAFSGFKTSFPMPDGGRIRLPMPLSVSWAIERLKDSTPTAQAKTSVHCEICILLLTPVNLGYLKQCNC